MPMDRVVLPKPGQHRSELVAGEQFRVFEVHVHDPPDPFPRPTGSTVWLSRDRADPSRSGGRPETGGDRTRLQHTAASRPVALR
jgi:hypothetical protein